MTDRSVSVRLRAEVADFKREIGSAAGSLDTLAKRAGGAEKVAQTSLGRLAQSARLQRESWQTAGTALLGFGAAVTGIGIAVGKTGVSYNSLQQTSRAALRTLTGSAEAANAQMDKLDEFARTSPFAKDVFIRAQQQMLGFGIESQKVIPYLSAINDAVAATGGSNQDIAELTRIFSQVQAASKITAVDLMQFGQRGVDAATLIGSQMGKTGAEIRGEITSGTIDAGAALDALAAGMSERFEGASANVKNTFAGAFDRVKAAWRDLSSDLSEPLVGTEGGGLATAGLNQLADALRAFQDLPDPVKQTAAALGGVTGAAALAGGAFLTLAPRALDTYTALKELRTVAPGAATGLGKVARAAGGALVLVSVAAAIKSMTDALARDKVREVDNLADALGDLANGAERVPDFGSLFEDRNTLRWFQDDIKTSEEALKAFADQAQQALGEGFADKLERFLGNGSLAKFTAQTEQIDDALSAMVGGGSATKAAEAFRQLADAAERQGVPVERLREMLPGYTAAIEANADAQGELGDEYATTTGKIDEQVQTMEELLDAQRRAAGIVLSAIEGESRFQEAIDNATTAVKENGQTLDLNTEKGRANQKALNDLATAGWDNVEALLAQDGGSRKARDAMQRARDAFITAAEAAGMGTDEAGKLADQLGLIPSNVNTLITANAQDAIREAEAALRAIGAIPTYRKVTIDGSLTSSFEAAQRAAASTSFTTLRRAGGGRVYGPGTTTSDSIPAMLSDREWVLKASAADYYGDTVLHALNQKRIPREFFTAIGLAEGGPARRTYQPTGYAGGGRVATGHGGASSTVTPAIQVTNYYPQAEPTSVTVNRGLQYAAALGVV